MSKMASETVDSTLQSSKSGSDLVKKVRVVAKIRPFLDSEIDSSKGFPETCISVQKPTSDSSDYVTIFLGDQTPSHKEHYRLDYCYKQEEDSSHIFSQEVKPLLPQVFQGFNTAILAYGARQSGKTYLIQGSDEKPGLASLAIAEILSMCVQFESMVSISCYEVYQDRVYDILEPKKQEVLVLEKNGGQIQLKGLSKIPVNSVSEFNKLYLHAGNQQRQAQKQVNDVAYRTHKGLIMYVSSAKNSEMSTVGKLSFIDLAGYEDVKRLASDSSHLVESAKSNNKSLYSLQNVLYALNANENRVPFREAKVTRLLQHSIGVNSRILMITCLIPTPCQDTIHTISLSSRSCQAGNHTYQDSIMKSKRKQIPSTLCSLVSAKVKSPLPKSANKLNMGQFYATEKKISHMPSAKKGEREQCGVTNLDITSMKEISKAMVPATMEENSVPESSTSNFIAPIVCFMAEEDTTSQTEQTRPEISSVGFGANPLVSSLANADCDVEKKDSPISVSKHSPPVSERLREITNTLKSFWTNPIPVCVKTPIGDMLHNSQASGDPLEPKTPGIPFCLRAEDNNLERSDVGTPREIYQIRSCGLKQSMVKEYLRYLNNASKEELQALQGIGEKRAKYILELREKSPDPFKDLEDLRDIGLSAKQIKGIMRKAAGALFI